MSRPRQDDPGRFRREDSDETEGRRIYRVAAEREARPKRRVRLRTKMEAARG